MRFLLITILLTNIAFANSDKVMDELFQKYADVLKGKSGSTIESVFTEKFIKQSGGQKELQAKIKHIGSLSKVPEKFKITWKKGKKNDLYLVNIIEAEPSSTSFVVISENGKFKIDETINTEE